MLQDLTIQMLENNEVEEANQIITPQQAKILADYFNEQDDTDTHSASSMQYLTMKEAVEVINSGTTEYRLETLQHCVVCLYPEKYNGLY